jgi:hypothetical protein
MIVRFQSVFAFFAGWMFVSAASAATWSIDSSASTFTLNVPNQSIVVDGANSTARVRNQSGGTAWTTNTTHISGSVNTDYDESGQTIKFLGGQVDVHAVNSGSFQPNPAVWDSGAGVFTDNSSAPADLGGVLQILPPPIGTFSFPFSVYDTTFDVSSGALTFVLNGAVNLQANGGMTLGSASSMIGVKGGSLGLLGTLPSSDGPFSFTGANNSLTGTISAVGAARHLVIPFQQNFNIVVDGITLQANSSGTLVMNLVPEPSSFVLAGFGLVSLLICLRRNRFAAMGER